VNLSRGIKRSPVRAVIYSPEGRGKSTLASLLPDPVFIDVEGGTHQLDVVRCEPQSWTDLLAAFKEIGGTQYRTAVIDTADWAERLCSDDLCARAGKKSIEDFGYGKGYIHLVEEFGRALKASDWLISKGINVVWLAHSKVVRTSPPDQTDGFDRYELKLSKQVAPLLKEWADLILFANVEMTMVTGSDGKVKAQGGKARVLHTVGTAAWDAKNRYGLPETLPMERDTLAPELARIFFDQIAPTVRKPDAIPGAAGDDTAPGPVPAEARRENSPVHAPTVPKAAGEAAPEEDPTITRAFDPAEVQKALAAAREVPGTFADPDLAQMFGGQEAAAHEYLSTVKKWITPTQPLSALHPDHVQKIKDKPKSFAAAAKLTINQGAA